MNSRLKQIKNSTLGTEWYIGLLSGTSMDGIDAALIDFNDSPKLIASHSIAIPRRLKQNLWTLILDKTTNSALLKQTDCELGHLFAQASNELLTKVQVEAQQISAIGSHGQTIQHQPNATPPFTLQIGDPNIIMRETNITTVANFRAADIAAGGQGAPLAPLFHHQFMRSNLVNRAIVNIGGIANITFLPKDDDFIMGFDTGPGNGLLDAWIKQQKNKEFDHNGQWAANGQVQPKLLNKLLDDPFFQQNPPKSTGKDYFNLQWLIQRLSPYKAADVQATLAELTAYLIAAAIKQQNWHDSEIIVCGGGVHNLDLLKRIQRLTKSNKVLSSSVLGFAPDWLEANLFAWLAKLRLKNQYVDTRKITGAKEPVLLGEIHLLK